MEKTI